jgi:predicted aspartyl protease
MNLKNGPYCFTKTFDIITKVIITDCGISLPFDPKFQPNFRPPKKVSFSALWDTGATNSVISQNVVDALNLKSTGKVKSFHASGQSFVNTFNVNAYLPNHIVFNNLTVSIGILNGFDILIGMDMISKGDFSITNFNNKTCFSFRIPSLFHTDFVKDKCNNVPIPKLPIITNQNPNDKCQCGSGKKFKHCCGKKY